MPKYNSFAMKVDYKKNQYNCRGFGHLARYCRDQKIIRESKRIEIINNNEYLKEEKSLEVFN